MARRETAKRAEAMQPSDMLRWLLEPNAAADDPSWQGRMIWQLVVAAPSAAFARLEAERWALDHMPAVHIGNESISMRAGFIDEKLYFARLLPENVGPLPDEFSEANVLVLAGPMQSEAHA